MQMIQQKDEIIQYVDRIVSTINPGVLPDNSDINNASATRINLCICNKTY